MIIHDSKIFYEYFDLFMSDIEYYYMLLDEEEDIHGNKLTFEQLESIKELDILANELFDIMNEFREAGKVKRMMELLDNINEE